MTSNSSTNCMARQNVQFDDSGNYKKYIFNLTSNTDYKLIHRYPCSAKSHILKIKCYPLTDSSFKYMRKPGGLFIDYNQINSSVFKMSVSTNGFSNGYMGVENFNYTGAKIATIVGNSGTVVPDQFIYFTDMNWLKLNIQSNMFTCEGELVFLLVVESPCFLFIE